MKKNCLLLLILGLLFLTAGTAFASDDYKEGYRSKVYGTVEKVPADFYGTWIIDGHQVLVSRSTRIEQEYGRADVGAYVEVKGRNDGQLLHAYELETKRGAEHYGDDREQQRLDHGELYGRVSDRPENGLGIWLIGDLEVVVDERTRLDNRRGPLVIGALVEVKGSYRDHRFHAHKIKRSSD